MHRINDTLGWEDKVWGRVAHVLISPHAMVSYLEIQSGTYCSKHVHRDRTNLFILLSGRVIVETFGAEYVRHILWPGEVLHVDANIVHRFEVQESGRMIEVYHPARPDAEVRMDDIERIELGGML